MVKYMMRHYLGILTNSDKRVVRVESANDSIKFFIEPKTTKEIFADHERKRLDKMKALIPDFSNNILLN